MGITGRNNNAVIASQGVVFFVTYAAALNALQKSKCGGKVCRVIYKRLVAFLVYSVAITDREVARKLRDTDEEVTAFIRSPSRGRKR